MLILKEQVQIAQSSASVPNPPAGYVAIFINSANGHLSQKDSSGVVIDLTTTGAGGGITLTEIEIDFGGPSTPVSEWTISAPGVVATDKILITLSPNPATGRIGNDWAGDVAQFTALAGTDQFTLSAVYEGRIYGARKVYYQVVN